MNAYEILGLENENNMKKVIEDFLDTPLTKTSEKYNHFDFINVDKSLYVELKSRSFTSTKYDTFFISVNKYNHIKSLINNNLNVSIFIFYKFTDKLLYLKIDRDLINNNSYIVCDDVGTEPKTYNYNHKYCNYIVKNYYFKNEFFKLLLQA